MYVFGALEINHHEDVADRFRPQWQRSGKHWGLWKGLDQAEDPYQGLRLGWMQVTKSQQLILTVQLKHHCQSCPGAGWHLETQSTSAAQLAWISRPEAAPMLRSWGCFVEEERAAHRPHRKLLCWAAQCQRPRGGKAWLLDSRLWAPSGSSSPASPSLWGGRMCAMVCVSATGRHRCTHSPLSWDSFLLCSGHWEMNSWAFYSSM